MELREMDLTEVKNSIFKMMEDSEYKTEQFRSEILDEIDLFLENIGDNLYLYHDVLGLYIDFILIFIDDELFLSII